jgi:hypothetical protein
MIILPRQARDKHKGKHWKQIYICALLAGPESIHAFVDACRGAKNAFF